MTNNQKFNSGKLVISNFKLVIRKQGFTLLEVLIAGGILFMVSAAIVGLNNSIIAGTAVNADVTVLNRWSSEGLELVTASRDNNLLSSNNDGSNQIWFGPATATNQYGWYVLSQPTANNWALVPATAAVSTMPYSQFANAVSGVSAGTLTSQSLTAYRLICIEAVAAVDSHDDNGVSCNTVGGVNTSAIPSDGLRTNVAYPCDANDAYCASTVASLNRNQQASLDPSLKNIIPPGNAVKVRAVVVTQDKSNYTVSDVASLLTNWKGFEQL